MFGKKSPMDAIKTSGTVTIPLGEYERIKERLEAANKMEANVFTAVFTACYGYVNSVRNEAEQLMHPCTRSRFDRVPEEQVRDDCKKIAKDVLKRLHLSE